MNKAQLVSALAAKSGLSKKDSEKALKAFVTVITDTLAKNDKIQLVGFGTFAVKDRPSRVARNPRTGEAIKVKASKAATFKAGKALKDSVNSKKKSKK